MRTWEERPSDVAHLLNPAFCGEIIRRAAEAYYKETGQGIPFSLCFLLLPIVLHKTTRDAMPKRQNRLKPMHAWLQENPELRVGFVERARSMTPHVKESISFLLQNSAVLNERENFVSLLATPKPSSTRNVQDNSEIIDCYKKAELVGRWFAMTQSPSTIFIMWGVRP